MADFGILDRFFQLEREKYGKANYHFKDDMLSSKIRAFYARPFCPDYMQSFSTTMYPDTFYAVKKRGNPESCLETEFHENVHKWDRWSQGIKFTFKYIWPHWMGIPFLLGAVALGGLWSCVALGSLLVLLHAGLVALAVSAGAREDGLPSRGSTIAFYVLVGIGALGLLATNIWFARWWAFLWAGAVLFLSPWPFKPVGRRNAELRGYTMSLYRIWLKYKNQLNEQWWKETIERYVKTFSGPAYFFMERNEDWTRRELEFQVGRFKTNEEAFLQNWAWRQKRGMTYPNEAEPYRMAKSYIDQEQMFNGA
jgi:hypothetical protein